MDCFTYRSGQLFAENAPLATIAEQVGTPCYVYSRRMIEDQYRAFDDAFDAHPHLVCYAVKANSNLAILNILARQGSGFDIVSGGELERVLRAGGDPSTTVFSGVGKSDAEIRRALEVGIHSFNVESDSELSRLDVLAGEFGKPVSIAVRVNPDVDPNTHPYIATGLKQNKFGVPIGQAAALYTRAQGLRNVNVTGVACHIGSQLLELAPFLDAVGRVLGLVEQLRRNGFALDTLDLGGGLGIRYRAERPPRPDEYVRVLLEALDACGEHGRDLRIMIEPGRALVGQAGLLLTRVQYLKHGEAKNFAMVDMAMTELLRPALYQAWHEVTPVYDEADRHTAVYDVVGPVCESADFLARDRELAIAPGDLLAIRSAGAYAASMGSRYNTRPLAAEVMVDGDAIHIVRRRETIDEMLATESMLPE
ncbi:MAG: diaminopimelate decarboxylase [Acidiferrobacterales bacterium]